MRTGCIRSRADYTVSRPWRGTCLRFVPHDHANCARRVEGITMVDHVSERTSLPPDPGPDQRSRSRPARNGAADHRPSKPRVRIAGARSARRHQGRLQDVRAGRHLSGLGQRRLGGLPGQYAVAGRQGDRVRERRVRQALVRRGQAARPGRRSCPHRVGQRR